MTFFKRILIFDILNKCMKMNRLLSEKTFVTLFASQSWKV